VKIANINGKLEEVKGIMVDNIDKVLERGAKIETLVDKTGKLQTEAWNFRGKAKELAKSMFWQNMKHYWYIVLIVVLILGLFVVLMSVLLGRRRKAEKFLVRQQQRVERYQEQKLGLQRRIDMVLQEKFEAAHAKS
jgi:vesicle-associated membrane protein 7